MPEASGFGGGRVGQPAWAPSDVDLFKVREPVLDQHEAKHEYLATSLLELPEDRSGMIDRHLRMLNTKVKVGSFLTTDDQALGKAARLSLCRLFGFHGFGCVADPHGHLAWLRGANMIVAQFAVFPDDVHDEAAAGT